MLARALGLGLLLSVACSSSDEDGCKTDNDCKGDRICESGQCVSPGAGGSGAVSGGGSGGSGGSGASVATGGAAGCAAQCKTQAGTCCAGPGVCFGCPGPA